MSFKTLTVSPLDLILDYENPRFIIPPNATQDSIRLYLLQYEGIEELAKGINDSEGLLLGERVIVCYENDKLVVLEGNRRVCACQLLLSPDFVPQDKKIPVATPITFENIKQITVDVADSRTDALSSLAAKHIDGIKRWSTLSKQKFYTKLFNAGKSISYISEITETNEAKVRKGIVDYKLINYAFNLNVWTDDEKMVYFDLQKLKPAPFLRVFTTKSQVFNMSTKELLKLSYDANSLEPISELNKSIFDEAIHLIAKGAFIDESFNTRNIIDNVPGIVELLMSSYNINEEIVTPQSTEESLTKIVNYQDATKLLDSDSKNNTVKKDGIGKSEDNNNTCNKEEQTNSVPIENRKFKGPNFFEDLIWVKVDSNDINNHGLLYLAQEIVNMSKNNSYKRFPISATILMRSLLEQSIIYHLRKKSLYDIVAKGYNAKTPPLEKLINYCTKNLPLLFENEKNFERSFTSFATNSGTKDYMDMVIHNPHLIIPKGDILDSIANTGLKSYISILLNS